MYRSTPAKGQCLAIAQREVGPELVSRDQVLNSHGGDRDYCMTTICLETMKFALISDIAHRDKKRRGDCP